eukprot:1138223-Pelagomonas_calceolata.AAC.7
MYSPYLGVLADVVASGQAPCLCAWELCRCRQTCLHAFLDALRTWKSLPMQKPVVEPLASARRQCR